MNNLRKIKRKKKINLVNPEEIAEQKLIQISNFYDEKIIEYEDDLFNNNFEKLNQNQQSNLKKHRSNHIQKNIKQISRLSKTKEFYTQKLKINNLHSNDEQLKENPNKIKYFQQKTEKESKISQLKMKTPIIPIRYILVDRRDDQISANKQTKCYSLSKLRRKVLSRRIDLQNYCRSASTEIRKQKVDLNRQTAKTNKHKHKNNKSQYIEGLILKPSIMNPSFQITKINRQQPNFSCQLKNY